MDSIQKTIIVHLLLLAARLHLRLHWPLRLRLLLLLRLGGALRPLGNTARLMTILYCFN